MILCFSVVARMNTANDGGSSRVFKKALNADVDNICTSSMMKSLYVPCAGGIRTCSLSVLIYSTELLEAASSSMMLGAFFLSNERHERHVPQASKSSEIFSQLMVLARMRAVVVFPTPLGPQNKKACAT